MSSIPKTMKGVAISKTGGVEVLEYKADLPVPQPKDGEVLIKIDYIGVNYIDTYFRTGLYPAPELPFILGREVSGTIVGVGPGNTYGLKEGARVASLTMRAYGEYVAAPALTTHTIPDDIDNKTAAATILQGLTAWTLIRDAHFVNKGDWTLVHAAAGGMGLWLCQLIKAVGGRVIGTASTAEKRTLAEANGAEITLDYPERLGKDEFISKIKEITGGTGVPVVFDGVGKSTFDIDFDVVARKGSVISFGNASGAVPPFTIARLSGKNVRLMRPTLFNFIATRGEFEQNIKDLFEAMGKYRVDVRVHEVYDLKDVARAHQDLEGRKTTGKLLLRP